MRCFSSITKYNKLLNLKNNNNLEHKGLRNFPLNAVVNAVLTSRRRHWCTESKDEGFQHNLPYLQVRPSSKFSFWNT